jgi:hypothetical protein
MKEVTKEGTISEFEGKTLDTPIKFSYSFTEYETFAEMQAANDLLSNDEQVKVRNTKRENKARQAADQAAKDAAGLVKSTPENSAEVRWKNMVSLLVKDGKTQDEAETIASTLIQR